MRLPLFGLAVALGLSTLATTARAQLTTIYTDPALLYYGVYLPRQQAQAMQPGPEATINAFAANRQQYAATNRNDMFDPNANMGLGGVDLGPDFSVNSGRRKSILNVQGRYGVHGGNLNGLGPQGYYGQAKLSSYYRELKTGRGKNTYTYTPRSRGFSMGGMGAGGAGLPGPR